MYDRMISAYEASVTPLISTRKHDIYAVDIVWQQFMREGKFFNFKTGLGYQRPSATNVGFQ